MDLSFSFLKPGVEYEATMYYDAPSSEIRTHVGIQKKIVNNKTKLTLSLLASGGQAIEIKPIVKK